MLVMTPLDTPGSYRFTFTNPQPLPASTCTIALDGDVWRLEVYMGGKFVSVRQYATQPEALRGFLKIVERALSLPDVFFARNAG